MGETSTSAYPSIKPSDIEALELLSPPVKEQKSIASILGALDYKIKNNSQIKKRYTLSRYEYAKKELGYKLFKKYCNLKTLNVPIIKNNKNKVEIFGNKFMTTLFNFLLFLNFINSVTISKLKKMIRDSINEKIQFIPFKMKPLGLSIPRSLLIDRLLRFIYD